MMASDGFIQTVLGGRRRDAAASVDSSPRDVLDGPTRAAQIALTYQRCAVDADFAALIAQGDAARDRGDWQTAAERFGRALERYPLHAGYSVQLGHMLKEQGRFPDAEIQYRSAIALGDKSADTREHLAFVCARQDHHAPALPCRIDEPPMAASPCAADLRTLVWLFWHAAHVPAEETVGFMRSAATCEALAIALIGDERFVRRNARLLEIIHKAS
ncbi:tetratricopeptide repeat protein [Iodidimonas sp. SYSU 1G8]|uniref:tetratricopeptide repeat protein n=1 Tax=Iodidimonas sp. SYSU 1G8 TaxID=3133967 RepID=UPI0031FE928E